MNNTNEVVTDRTPLENECIQLKRELLNMTALYIGQIEKEAFKDWRREDSETFYDLVHRKKKNGQWGYYRSPNVHSITKIIDKYNLTNVIDLGSGPGTLLKILDYHYHGQIQFTGVEIEDKLIEIHRIMDAKLIDPKVKVYKRDIFKLRKANFKDIDGIYFWEPVGTPELAEKFVAKLAKVTVPNQIIIYQCSGQIGEYLSKLPTIFTHVESINGLFIFKRI